MRRPSKKQFSISLLERARQFRASRSRVNNTLEEFEAYFAGKDAGFAWVARGKGRCILTGQPSAPRVVMARAY